MRGFRVALLALLVLPIVCLAAANAFAATESGYLYGPGASYTFTVNAGSVNYVEVNFQLAEGRGGLLGQGRRTGRENGPGQL